MKVLEMGVPLDFECDCHFLTRAQEAQREYYLFNPTCQKGIESTG